MKWKRHLWSETQSQTRSNSQTRSLQKANQGSKANKECKTNQECKANQACKIEKLGTVSLDTEGSIYKNCFNTRAVGCYKPREKRDASGQKITRCTCHVVPDAVPMAFPLEMVEKTVRERLVHQGLYFTVSAKHALETVEDPSHTRMSTYTMNPVFAMFALRHILEKLDVMHDKSFEYIRYGLTQPVACPIVTE